MANSQPGVSSSLTTHRNNTPTPAPAQIAGQKRKRPTEKKYYGVKTGKRAGVYETWEECLNQVRGHKGALFKAFPSLHEAQAFVDGKLLAQPAKSPGEQKFYAVQNGRVPGVYTDWSSAQAQIINIRNPKHKKFTTRAEAELFVAAGKKTSAYDTPAGLTPDEENRRVMTRNSAPGLIINGNHTPKDKHDQPFELGRGPLPPGAEDGYDPNIKLNPNGEIVNRSEEEKAKTKLIPKERNPPGMLRIYTDGSSLKNGQAGARAGVGVFFGPQDPKYELTPASSTSSSPCGLYPKFPTSSVVPTSKHTVYSIDWHARGAPPPTKRPKLTWRYRNVSEALKGSKQTNQRAELTAILRALDIAPRHRDVTIYTDSKYSIDCVTSWYKNWQKNGWLNSKGKNVENKDLVQDIRERMEERQILGRGTYFVWVKGHANDAGNIAADRLANEGALMDRVPDDDHDIGNGSIERDDTVDDEEDRDDDDEENEDVKESLKMMRQAMEEDRRNGIDY